MHRKQVKKKLQVLEFLRDFVRILDEQCVDIYVCQLVFVLLFVWKNQMQIKMYQRCKLLGSQKFKLVITWGISLLQLQRICLTDWCRFLISTYCLLILLYKAASTTLEGRQDGKHFIKFALKKGPRLTFRSISRFNCVWKAGWGCWNGDWSGWGIINTFECHQCLFWISIEPIVTGLVPG